MVSRSHQLLRVGGTMTARIWLWVVMALGTNACAGEVELLRHDQHGGELRLSRPAAVSAADARLVMAKHCETAAISCRRVRALR